ncbi:TnsA endonuclease N-terminal domain-containing protein [Pseudomonas syringae]|nr:TnsA endonuclease N-terminal domain-containing protein [Pseudomonas syringae]
MVKSRLTGRTHHYLSRQEFKVHLHAEYATCTKDIREQFALLPWQETFEIASELGVHHPSYPRTATPLVMTTDLVLTLSTPSGEQLLAISVKLAKDLTPRTYEKLLIEKQYWNRRGIKWLLATEDSISEIRTKNLAFFETSLSDERALTAPVAPEYFSQRFVDNHSPELSFLEIMISTTRELGIDIPTGHALLGMAVWNHQSLLSIDEAVLTHRGRVFLMER